MPPTVRGKLNTYPMGSSGACTYRWRINIRQILWQIYWNRDARVSPPTPECCGFEGLHQNTGFLLLAVPPSSIDPTACIRIHSLQRFVLEEESGYCYKNQGGVRWDLSPGPPPRIQEFSLEWFGMSSLWVLWSRIRGAVSTDSTLSTHNIPSFQVLGGQLGDDSSMMHSRFLIEWFPFLNGIGTLK